MHVMNSMNAYVCMNEWHGHIDMQGPVDIAAGDGKIAPDAEMDRSGSTGAWMENEELARSQDDDFLDTLNIKVQ